MKLTPKTDLQTFDEWKMDMKVLDPSEVIEEYPYMIKALVELLTKDDQAHIATLQFISNSKQPLIRLKPNQQEILNKVGTNTVTLKDLRTSFQEDSRISMNKSDGFRLRRYIKTNDLLIDVLILLGHGFLKIQE